MFKKAFIFYLEVNKIAIFVLSRAESALIETWISFATILQNTMCNVQIDDEKKSYVYHNIIILINTKF